MAENPRAGGGWAQGFDHVTVRAAGAGRVQPHPFQTMLQM